MLTLYGTQGLGLGGRSRPRSTSPALAYRQVEAASWKPRRARRAEARQPLAQIPTLVLDDGSMLTESAAILIHLGLAHPESGLLASEPRGARSRSAAWSTSPPTAMPASASSTIPSAGIPIPTTRSRQAMQTRGQARLHELSADLRRPVPGGAVAVGRSHSARSTCWRATVSRSAQQALARRAPGSQSRAGILATACVAVSRDAGCDRRMTSVEALAAQRLERAPVTRSALAPRRAAARRGSAAPRRP